MGLLSEFTKGISKENPVFVQALGLCPTLAVSNSVKNGIGMGIAATSVLLGSNLIVSIIRRLVPSKIRLPSFIVVIATFVTIADMVMEATSPEIHKDLGIFVPLIVVNCIILARAEVFASKNAILPSLSDALGMGVGFTLALVLIGSVREILGSGSILGIPVMGRSYEPVLLMVLPPGAFLTIGLFMGLFRWMGKRKSPRSKVQSREGAVEHKM